MCVICAGPLLKDFIKNMMKAAAGEEHYKMYMYSAVCILTMYCCFRFYEYVIVCAFIVYSTLCNLYDVSASVLGDVVHAYLCCSFKPQELF